MTRIPSAARLLGALGLALTLTACSGSGLEPVATAATQAASIPSGTPDPSTSTPALSAASVPTEADLEWHKPGDWFIVSDQAGEGRSPSSACQQGSLGLLPGAGDMWNAQYVMGEHENARVLVVDFDAPGSAVAAYDTITGWSANCDPAPSSTSTVATLAGRASFVEVTLPGPETSQTQGSGTFQSIGTVVNDDRIAYVVMTITGMDNTWDYAPDGPVGAMHPMFRTLPKVSERIVD